MHEEGLEEEERRPLSRFTSRSPEEFRRAVSRSRSRSPVEASGSNLEEKESVVPLGVFNLAYHSQEHELEEIFSPFGRIGRIDLVKDQETGRPKGYAFVYMEQKEDAEEALRRLHETSFNGRNIRLEFCPGGRPHPAGFKGNNRRRVDGFDRRDYGRYEGRRRYRSRSPNYRRDAPSFRGRYRRDEESYSYRESRHYPERREYDDRRFRDRYDRDRSDRYGHY